MGASFSPLLISEPDEPVVLPGTATFDANAVPRGSWPAEFGGAARASILGEPLTTDRWALQWHVPLGSVSPPRCVLAGAGRVVVTGRERRGVWRTDGTWVDAIPVAAGVAFLDADAERYLCDDGHGLVMYALKDAQEDAIVNLAFPTHQTQNILQGPDGVLVFSSADTRLHASSPDVVVEAFVIDDYAEKSEHGIFYGFRPIGGLVRHADAHARVAATASGPVIATADGVRFCDWQLRTLHDVAVSLYPLTLSTDGMGRAYVVNATSESARLLAVESGGVVFDVALPWSASRFTPPPIVTATRLVLTPPGRLLVLDANGSTLLHEERPASPPATMTSNGILLLPHEKLLGVTADGERFPIWAPPAPLRSAATLVNGTIYVATADDLHALG